MPRVSYVENARIQLGFFCTESMHTLCLSKYRKAIFKCIYYSHIHICKKWFGYRGFDSTA